MRRKPVPVRRKRRYAADATKWIWQSPDELAALPTSGAAWDYVNGIAQAAGDTPDIEDQDSNADKQTLAKAYVAVRTDNATMQQEVRTRVMAAVGTEGTDAGGARTLALGRNLTGYVISAQLVGLSAADDATFRAWLVSLWTLVLNNRTLISTQEDRPNNWGTHAGTAVMAAALYLDDEARFDHAADVFAGYLGNRSVYAGFNYGDLWWQSDEANPVGINPLGATKSGQDVDGVLPDDMRRGGTLQDPPVYTQYPLEALQGAFAQAEILHRRGRAAYSWSDSALKRACEYLGDLAVSDSQWLASGDDGWLPWLIKKRYGIEVNGALSATAQAGKSLGYTQWTHA